MKQFLKNSFSFSTVCLLCILATLAASSCKKDDDPVKNPDTTGYLYKNGIFVINEGLFNQGSASLTFYSQDSGIAFHNVFSSTNQRPLGDVGFSMMVTGDTGFIVVNNSGTIEVVDMHTMRSIKTISGLSSPRYICPVSNSKAYISSFYESEIYILNPVTLEITGTIPTGRTLEQMVRINDEVFAASWSQWMHPTINNNQILVIHSITDAITDSISVTKEPNSMVVDKNQHLWVLCSGGYNNEEMPSLIKIAPQERTILMNMNFLSEWAYPSRLTINSSGDELYYIDYPNIYNIDIQATSLPVMPFIDGNGKSFYSLSYDPDSHLLIASDAKDFQQPGTVYMYSPDGTETGHFEAGINPGFMLPFWIDKSE